MGLFDSFASASKKIFKGGKKEGDNKSGEQPLFTPPEIDTPAKESNIAMNQSLNASVMARSMISNAPSESVETSKNAGVNPAPVNTGFGFASPNPMPATPTNGAPAMPNEATPNQSLNASIMTGSMVSNAPSESVDTNKNAGVEPTPANPGFGFASPNPMPATPMREAQAMPSEIAPNQSLNASIMKGSMVSNTPSENIEVSQNASVELAPANPGFGFATPNPMPTAPVNEAPAMPFGQGAPEFTILGNASTNTPNGSELGSQNIGFENLSINTTSSNTNYDSSSPTSSPANGIPAENANVFTNAQSNIPTQDANTFVNKSTFVDTSPNGTPQIANPIPFGASYQDATMQNGNQQKFFIPEEQVQAQTTTISNSAPIDPFNINQSNQENQVTPFKTM